MGRLRHAVILAGMALTMGATALLPAVGWAQAMAGNPLVSGDIIRDFARITFFWPEKIDMSATTSGNRLVVRFDRPVNPNFGEILRALYPYVTKAELTGNQRTIIFTMQQPYKIRSFITDSESGVDILGIQDPIPAAPEATVTAPRPLQPIPQASPPPQQPPVQRPVVMPPPPLASKPAAPERAAAAPQPEPQQPAPEAEQDLLEETVAAIDTLTEERKAAEEAATAQQAAATKPEPAPQPTPVAPQAMAPLPVTQTTPSAPRRMQVIRDYGNISGEGLAVELSTVEKQPNLRFAFKERVAAAAWQRGRTVMLWFSKPVNLSGLSDVKEQSSSWLVDIRQLGGDDFTLLRLDLLTDVHMKALKDPEGYGWNLRVSGEWVKPDTALQADINSSTGAPYVFVPVTQTENITTIRDPEVGDVLSIVPVYSTDTGIYPARSFVDFDLLQTMQGVVVRDKSDRILVERLPNGVRISTPDGLFVTEGITAEQAAAAGAWDNRAALFKPTLFPYQEWKTDSMTAMREREAYLLNQISTAPDMQIVNERRLELAQLYLAHGMYNESVAVLGRIRRDDLEFFRNHKLAALEGAAYLLNYRMQEAQLSLSSDTLDGTEEGELLRKAVAASMDSSAEPVPYMAYNQSYIRQYPPALRQRLAIIAADHALQQDDRRTPPQIFEALEEDKITGAAADYIDFLKAKTAAASGRIGEAERLWQKLADKLDDRQFRARSEYSLVLLGLEEGNLTPEQAVERLDKLRILWRGDDLERSLLMVLGQLHVNLGNYWEGMKVWEELLQYYPNSPSAMEAYQRLAGTFRNLFLEDGADAMDPVKALALYSEFQELTPLGDDGNRLIQKLVDRMVAIDLLEQAAERMETQIEYRLKGEEKSRAGARLAMIYLLNREPEKALAALQKSREDDVPAGLSLERNRIAAQALIDLDRPDQSLSMIEGDYSPDGENVRLEAYWAKEDWAYVIDLIEVMLRSRPDLNAPFTAREGQRLLQLALAYIFVGEFDQLKYLRDAYTPLMENNPYKDEFLFLTEERIQTSSNNFGKVIDNISSMESFMDSYRDRLKQSDLSETVGNSANDAPDAKAPENPQ
jgi:hypothetical protein